MRWWRRHETPAPPPLSSSSFSFSSPALPTSKRENSKKPSPGIVLSTEMKELIPLLLPLYLMSFPPFINQQTLIVEPYSKSRELVFKVL